jgi:hypothetical protein
MKIKVAIFWRLGIAASSLEFNLLGCAFGRMQAEACTLNHLKFDVTAEV